MSRINDLIGQYCPDGVEFKPLGDLLSYEQPGKYLVKSTAYDDSYSTPVLTAGQTFILGYTDETENLYPASSKNPTIIFDDFTTAFKWVDFPFKAKSSAMKMLTPRPTEEVNFRFVYYAMLCIQFTPQEHARQWISQYSTFRVPVPPLDVQREIVKVLDTFTALEAALEAELDARRQQYKYYRDELLTFDHRAPETSKEWTTLSEVGKFTRGRRFTNNDFVESGVGCIHYGEIYTHYGLSATETKSFLNPELAATLRRAKKGELVIAGTGESVEDIGKAVAWLGDDEVAVHDDCYIFSHSLNPKYMAYFFQSSHFNEQKVKHAAGAKMIRVSSEGLGKIRIYVPPVEEQERIVSILDSFDALINDPTSGLPAEIQARRQQYEYYRIQLLTFEEAS
ncbi:MAG: restriction endonuclease subunit S [Candidatus Melainabacteria bacterium]|nr:MAG: restriction endonuclease subunit S [Candidatus Melainabacteria bacterium]